MAVIDVRESTELVKYKEFVVFQPWRKVYEFSNGTVNDISEVFCYKYWILGQQVAC